MAEPLESSTQIEGRRLATPKRDALLEHFARLEDFSKTVVAVEVMVVVGVAAWFIGKRTLPLNPAPWIAFLLGSLGVFRWVLHHFFLNKKRVEEVRPDAQLGQHTRESLTRVTRQVFDRLGLDQGSAPVFLIRSKDVNAQAVRCELWPGKRVFNGVFLNRSIIHLLDEPELASVIGHELGHVFPYAPLLSRSFLVHSLFAGSLSFFIASFFANLGPAIVAPMLILFGLDRLIAYPHIKLSRGIEFLCDDYGAKAAGLLPALSCEMKLGAEAETRRKLLLRVFEARAQGQKLRLADLFEDYEAATPFGKADPQLFEKEFSKLVAERRSDAGKISLGGFLQDVFGAEGKQHDEWVQEQTAGLRLLSTLPVLALDRGPYVLGSAHWNLEMAEELASAIDNQPGQLLFQSEAEIDDSDLSHPNTSRRILFLWRNREHYPAA